MTTQVKSIGKQEWQYQKRAKNLILRVDVNCLIKNKIMGKNHETIQHLTRESLKRNQPSIFNRSRIISHFFHRFQKYGQTDEMVDRHTQWIVE